MTELVLLGLFIAVPWVVYRDSIERGRLPASAWIVITWMVIFGTRPVTSWMSGPVLVSPSTEAYDEGNVTEALISLALITAAGVVLMRRRVGLAKVVGQNRWLFIVYAFWGASIAWSDYCCCGMRPRYT